MTKASPRSQPLGAREGEEQGGEPGPGQAGGEGLAEGQELQGQDDQLIYFLFCRFCLCLFDRVLILHNIQ